MWLALLQGVSLASIPLLSVGPFKIFVFSQALRQGWRAAVPLALTPLLADIPIVLLLWLVLREFPDWALDLLRLVGGLFYVYLAYGLVRSLKREVGAEALQNSPRRNFWQAMTAIWVSPGPYITWSTIGMPAVLGYAAESPWYVVAFLIGFYVVFIVGLAVEIFLIAQAGRVSVRANSYLIIGGAVFLVVFGLYQFWFGLNSLLAPNTALS